MYIDKLLSIAQSSNFSLPNRRASLEGCTLFA